LLSINNAVCIGSTEEWGAQRREEEARAGGGGEVGGGGDVGQTGTAGVNPSTYTSAHHS